MTAAPRAVRLCEVDLPRCSLRYGETTGAGTCPAVLGVDSADKCHNTPATCPVRDSYIDDPMTVRFVQNATDLPRELNAIPVLENVEISPSIVSLGRGLGQRESVSVALLDRPHSDTGGFDKYLADRAYNPFEQGTLFGKWRARSPFMRWRPMRLIDGFLSGTALVGSVTRHYLIDSFNGVTPAARFTITGKDPLKGLDDDRALAPRPSKGHLVADITATATSATLAPSGIGDANYAASGYLNLSGTEIVAFTRSGDTLTFASSGGNRVPSFNTVAVAHKAQDRAQECLYYAAQDPDVIIADLMTSYAAIDSDYVPAADWNSETSAFNGSVYTALIAEPTGVKTLVAELIEQAALSIWWDPITQTIRLRVLRAIPTDADLFDESIYDDLDVSEQPNLRVSQVWTYFAQINPLKKIDDLDNYRSTEVTVDLQAEVDYGSPAIKQILSRWIPQGGRAIVTRLNAKHLARYRDPPRRITFNLPRSTPAVPRTAALLGGGYQLAGWLFQDATGARINVPIQITSLCPVGAVERIEAEEMLFADVDDAGPADPTIHSIIIDSNSYNLNVRTIHDALYGAPAAKDTVNCEILTDVLVGSTSSSLKALDFGTWLTSAATGNRTSGSPIITGLASTADYAAGQRVIGTGIPADAKILTVDSGTQITLDKNATSGSSTSTSLTIHLVILNLILNSRIQAAGGNGAIRHTGVTTSFNAGTPGGVAIYTRYAVNMTFGAAAAIFGGGGGAGEGRGQPDVGKANTPGGGGAGNIGGTTTGQNGAQPGTAEAGGVGGEITLGSQHIRSGDGGDPGQDGSPGDESHSADGLGGLGGAAGAAIDGVSFVTVTSGTADIRGPQIN